MLRLLCDPREGLISPTIGGGDSVEELVDVRGAVFEGKEPSRRFLVDWMQRKAQREQTQRENDRAGLGLYACTWPGCGYADAAQHNVDTHYRYHSGEKPYSCAWPGCTYTAARQQTLGTHYQRHTGEKPYKCTSAGCTFAAVTQWHLSRHIAQRHQ